MSIYITLCKEPSITRCDFRVRWGLRNVLRVENVKPEWGPWGAKAVNCKASGSPPHWTLSVVDFSATVHGCRSGKDGYHVVAGDLTRGKSRSTEQYQGMSSRWIFPHSRYSHDFGTFIRPRDWYGSAEKEKKRRISECEQDRAKVADRHIGQL